MARVGMSPKGDAWFPEFDQAQWKRVSEELHAAADDGLELIRQLRRSERANMPVIIMSGNAEVKDAIDGMHLSVLDFLLKPIDTEKLTALIKRELHIE